MTPIAPYFRHQLGLIELPDWRVAAAWSSSIPGHAIPWLCTGHEEIKRCEQHHSFIGWLTPSDISGRVNA